MFCPYELTFLGQYFINVSLGLIALFILISLILLISTITEKVLPTAITFTFGLGMMIMLERTNLSLNYFLSNFFPYHMVDFDNYYIRPIMYIINDSIIPSHWWIMIIGIMQICLFAGISYKLALRFFTKNKELSH
ncbi:MAG: hypothetical protein ATN31_05705 [Candidatus Epulonipiscioides saccharophilum]|nr:MAG: hypothetical protein ATN31_05705 [Epulopiscium sp. AS2M-Bin001]